MSRIYTKDVYKKDYKMINKATTLVITLLNF